MRADSLKFMQSTETKRQLPSRCTTKAESLQVRSRKQISNIQMGTSFLDTRLGLSDGLPVSEHFRSTIKILDNFLGEIQQLFKIVLSAAFSVHREAL